MRMEIELVPILFENHDAHYGYFLFVTTDGAGFPHLIAGLTKTP